MPMRRRKPERRLMIYRVYKVCYLRQLVVHKPEVAGDQLVVVLEVGPRLGREAGGELVGQIEIEGDQPARRRVVLRGVGVP